MSKTEFRALRGFALPDDLHARLVRLGYRPLETGGFAGLEGYHLYTTQRDGVHTFVAADGHPRPYPLLVTGFYFHRNNQLNETANLQLERNALSVVIEDLQHIAWRRVHPSRWQQLFLRHRFAIVAAIAVAVLSTVFLLVDAASARINVFSFVRVLSSRLGDSGEENLGLLTFCARLLFVLVTTAVGYWIAGLFGAWRHPVMSVELSDKSENYRFGHEARRSLEELENEIEDATAAPSAATPTTRVPAAASAEPATWQGYDNFVSYEEFRKRLRLETKRAARFSHPLSCIIMSIEPKPGSTGVVAGSVEQCVRRDCSQLLWHEIRDIDSVARYGDSGFIILLPATGAKGACKVEEKLRTQVGSCDIGGCSLADATRIRTGVSCAAAGQRIEWEDLIRSAESSLRVGQVTPAPPPRKDTQQPT